jgi:hypothetical protein
MRGQFISINIFENLKVLVVFIGYDGFNIWFIIHWFLQGIVDFIEGEGKLFDITIILIGIVNDMPEYCSRDSTDLVPLLQHKSSYQDRGYCSMVG